MSINRTFFIHEWANINSDIRGELILEAIVKFCKHNLPVAFRNVFHKSTERDQVIQTYLELGGFVLLKGKSVPEKCRVKRVAACFKKGSREYPIILLMMMKIARKLDHSCDLELIFGAHLREGHEYAELHPKWSRDLAPTILEPRRYNADEEMTISFLKHGVDYLRTAARKCPNLVSAEIQNATREIASHLKSFEN